MRFATMITAVEVHAEGEPGRVITGGVGPIPGDSVLAKMRYLADQKDGLRKLMLREPRGYPGLCCNLLVPSSHPEADIGFVVMEQMEYAPMSGSNTICVTTALLETGILPMKEPVTELVLEAPAGLVRIRADCRDGKVSRVTFVNVPSQSLVATAGSTSSAAVLRPIACWTNRPRLRVTDFCAASPYRQWMSGMNR